MDLSAFGELLGRRSSCRAFLPGAVDRQVIEAIAQTAQKMPSWCNSQPWQVLVTQGDATERFREALYAHAQSGAAPTPDFAFPREYRGAYLARRRDSGFRLYEAAGIGRDDATGRARQSLENFRFFGAPHVAIITTDEALGVYGAVDCGGYVANWLVGAEAAGVDTVPQAAIALYSRFVREHFGIGDDRLVVCGISFGYRDPENPVNAVATPRASLGEAVAFRAE